MKSASWGGLTGDPSSHSVNTERELELEPEGLLPCPRLACAWLAWCRKHVRAPGNCLKHGNKLEHTPSNKGQDCRGSTQDTCCSVRSPEEEMRQKTATE
ncbi:hypothetical protein AAFF_G00263240 [Aldrovandia affinis]|uniref:Uncharacterized protein n=1 Tax=Aldrovandia affinis TaxID=143900 RepID=A0AAD7SUK3_9TELE|nr:hypothetical protein AAFF_G00263240 [Aldrovandia affinis]